MPYFRYFGPTAIMPGFKQMVVKVKGKQHSTAGTSTTDGEWTPPEVRIFIHGSIEAFNLPLLQQLRLVA